MSQTLSAGAQYAPHPRTRRAPLMLALAFALAALAASAAPARAQIVGAPNLVVSQFYTNGGEPGAAHPNDFIEIFNRGANTVDLRNYSIQVASPNGGTAAVIITFSSSQGAIPMQPGQYRTITLGSGPAQPPPAPPTLGPTGTIAVVRGRDLLSRFGCAVGQDPDIEDFVGYGGAACFEGTGSALGSTPALAVLRKNNGCTDTDNNAADFEPTPPHPTTGTSSNICGVPPGASTFQFSSSSVVTQENATSVQVTVTRTGGDTGAPATVDYATADNLATERSDYTTAIGTLRFAAGETSKTINVLINDDVLAEGAEVFDISLSNATGNAVLADPATARVTIVDNDATTGTVNPIDDPTFFVRTHYADFLGREPDQAGLDFWVGNITSCGADAQCVQVKRVNVSAAFFLSIEFQETGYYAYRLYKASFPNFGDAAPRPRGFPTYREFIRDSTEASRDVIVGVGNWQAQLEANKQALAEAFVQRGEFLARYPLTQTPAQFVDALNANANHPLSQSERDALVNELVAGTATRATALRRVAEDENFRQAELNRAFVLMQYFGYLRRSPNAAPDTNFNGYDFWLTKLNQFNGNFVDAEMVRAFIESIEYRQRFGQ